MQTLVQALASASKDNLSSDLDQAVKSVLAALDGYTTMTAVQALKIAPFAYEHAVFVEQSEEFKKMFGQNSQQTPPPQENALSPEEIEQIIKVTDHNTPTVQPPEAFRETYGA